MNGNDQAVAQSVMRVASAETTAFWMKDYAAWADCWLQTSEIRMAGWWVRGGIRITEGWDALSTTVQSLMNNNPTPNSRATQVRRGEANVRTSEQLAWVMVEQHGGIRERRI